MTNVKWNYLEYGGRWRISWCVENVVVWKSDHTTTAYKGRVELRDSGRLVQIAEKSFRDRGTARSFTCRARIKMRKYIEESEAKELRCDPSLMR